MQANDRVEAVNPPLAPGLTQELLGLWQSVFEADFGWLGGVLAGDEADVNEDTVYVVRRDERVVGTCRLTVSVQDSRLGCLGEVATVPDCRGEGLAALVCEQAAADFDGRGGRGLLLGTGNPGAARVYARLGWRYLAGTRVMLRVGAEHSPEEFMVNYFREGRDLPVVVRAGGPKDRVPLVPLILTPGDWAVLDANAGLGSTRYFTQRSCEGLHPRYAALGEGAWFVAAREDGALVGAGSVVVQDGEACVEAFAHPRYRQTLVSELYHEAMRRARASGAGFIVTRCAREDVVKRAALPGMGFCPTGRTRTVDVGEEAVEAEVWSLS